MNRKKKSRSIADAEKIFDLSLMQQIEEDNDSVADRIQILNENMIQQSEWLADIQILLLAVFLLLLSLLFEFYLSG